MTFRARLLLTMLGVIVFSTAVALYLAQRQSAAAYGVVVDDLLRVQAAAFQSDQALRHGFALEQAARLADSVRLFAALEAGDPAVYQIADDELRLGQYGFFRLLDAAGNLIPPPAALTARQVNPGIDPGALDPGGSGATDAVALGFIAVHPGRDGPAQPFRLLAAPIRSFDTLVGSLVLGQRVEGLSPRSEPGTAANLYSALWVAGQLLGGNVPATARSELLAALEADPEIAAGREITADGVGYRIQSTRINPDSAYPPAFLVSIFSLRAFAQEQRGLLQRIAQAGVAAAVLAGLLGLALARQLARPIANLVDATHRIRHGDYEHRLESSPTWEFDRLAESFNAMAGDLALKDRYHSVLQQVADPQVAEALIAGRIKLGGESREITVLFCDIREYTPITVGRPPEAVIELLNAHLGAMAEVVARHRGVINQFAGDSVMALFGAPKQYGDDAERAVACACAMMGVRAALNATTDLPIEVGIGIATGRMVAGCIGAESRSDYTAVGERVNLAARLSDAAPAGEILIDTATRECLSDTVRTDSVPPLRLKGFTAAIPAYRVVLPLPGGV